MVPILVGGFKFQPPCKNMRTVKLDHFLQPLKFSKYFFVATTCRIRFFPKNFPQKAVPHSQPCQAPSLVLVLGPSDTWEGWALVLEHSASHGRTSEPRGLVGRCRDLQAADVEVVDSFFSDKLHRRCGVKWRYGPQEVRFQGRFGPNKSCFSNLDPAEKPCRSVVACFPKISNPGFVLFLSDKKATTFLERIQPNLRIKFLLRIRNVFGSRLLHHASETMKNPKTKSDIHT